MEITLKPKHEKMIKKMVQQGQYDSSREIVEAAVERFLDEDYTERLKKLRGMIASGMKQAEKGQLVTGESVMAKLRKKQREYEKRR